MEDKSEIEYMQNVGTAAYNTYLIITGRETLDSFADKGEGLWFWGDPLEIEENREALIETLIMFFEDNDEFEKCIELQKLKNN